MAKVFEKLLGSAELEINGKRPERLLNVLSQRGIELWNARSLKSDALRFSLSDDKCASAIQTADECGINAKLIKRRGTRPFTRKFKKRWILLASAALIILSAYYLSLFIWEIEVTGNKMVPSGEIISALDEAGFGLGSFGPTANRERICTYARLKMGKLSWIAVNIYGCKAVVEVREGIEKPKIVDVDAPCDIVAAKTGVIDSFFAFYGNGTVKKGDTVLKGQTLVKGELDSISGKKRYVHSVASIKARIWYKLDAVMPLAYLEKTYTGETVEKNSITLAGLRINLYINSGISIHDCDNIKYKERPVIFGMFSLPVSLVGSVMKLYETSESAMDEKAAEEILKAGLERRLSGMINGGTIESAEYTAEVRGDCVYMSLRAMCIEDIAMEAPIAGPA